MSEWWTYSLHDLLLFSPRTYYRLIELYNADVCPMRVLAWLANALVAVLGIRTRRARCDVASPEVAVEDPVWNEASARRLVLRKMFRAECVMLVVLGAAWAWSAWGWLWQRYTTINWAATYMAGAFIVQAGMLLMAAMHSLVAMRSAGGSVIRGSSALLSAPEVSRTARPVDRSIVKERERSRSGRSADAIGFLLLIVSLLYPAIALFAGRSRQAAEIFAVMPDPTVIATLGAVVVLSPRPRWLLLFIPLLWCAVGGATLWAMRSPEALLLPMAGVAAIVAVSGSGARTTNRAAS